jgi:hypothetical protein
MSTKLTFEQWLASEKKKDIAFGYHSIDYQLKLYELYVEAKTFGKKKETNPKNKKTIVDEALSKLRIELASISTIELAKLTKGIVDDADLKDFMDVLPILQTQALQGKAVDEFLDDLKGEFTAAIRERVSAKASEQGIKMDYSNEVIIAKVDELVKTCSEMGKPILLNNLGINDEANFGGINKSKIGKTKTWEGA